MKGQELIEYCGIGQMLLFAYIVTAIFGIAITLYVWTWIKDWRK